MPARWRVTYSVAPAEAESHPGYPSLGITFLYEGPALLVGVQHELTCPDEWEPTTVQEASDEQLRVLWNILTFKRCVPLLVQSRSACPLSRSSTDEHAEHFIFAESSGLVANRLVMPREAALQSPPSRLSAWLTFANMAAAARSSADSLRNYFLILEDIYAGAAAPVAVIEVRHARNFVSHGSELNDDRLLKFLAKELGGPVLRFDPTDPNHQRFVSTWCARARTLVEMELANIL